MSAAKQIAVRAWGYCPSWIDIVALVVIGAALVVFYGAPWWAVGTSYAVGVPIVCGLLGCLEWVNELDEATYRPPSARDEGEPR